MRYIVGAATEKEINAHTKQNVCVGSVDRTLCPKMGKPVRLREREREKERDMVLARKNIFRRSVRGDSSTRGDGSRDSTKGPLNRR